MQFIPKGPDIPDQLLQKHEDGDVVFFCGAGISYPAKLPGFAGLVHGLYTGLGIIPSATQKAALKHKQFDTAIGLLEKNIVGGRPAVRRKLADILKADPTLPGALDTHHALLTLATNRGGRTRLITTNFDRLFEHARTRFSRSFDTFNAPLLPVPKSKWSGLVHLHGMLPLPAPPSDDDLNRLVASSGDFGLAYLTERWAARFVSELFRHYTVCFVGYSIDDPVLRYMMDALAADRQLGEPEITAYAFASYKGNKSSSAQEEWEAKGVVPLLYRQNKGDHSILHRTLQTWATTYRDGITGKESIVVKHAGAMPAGSTAQDNYVGRMLWALSEKTGMVARRFAELDPVPPFEWLEAFSDGRFGHTDLQRFGVSPDKLEDAKLKFSFVTRPAPYRLAPLMCLVTAPEVTGSWDPVMGAICGWLIRHLDDSRLLLWVVSRGCQLHPTFAAVITHQLQKQPPSPQMLILWRLVVSGRARSRRAPHDIYAWLMRFRAEGLSLPLRLKLRDILSPQVVIYEPLTMAKLFGDRVAGKSRLKDLVNWEIELSADHVHHALKDLRTHTQWHELLRTILSDLTGMLHETLDLMAMLEGITETHDHSYITRPAIRESTQDRDFPEWTALVTLLRDSWLAVLATSGARAKAEVECWRTVRYPLFRRMVLFSMTACDLYDSLSVQTFLLEEDAWWLWSVETQFEVLDLLTQFGLKSEASDVLALESAIIAGPPRRMFNQDVGAARLERIVESAALMRLRALQTNATLSQKAETRIAEILEKQPDLETDDERRQFPVWIGTGPLTGAIKATPTTRSELITWLIAHPEASDSPFEGDDWSARCQRDLKRPLTALLALASQGAWTATVWWQQALQAWSSEAFARRSWRRLWRVLGNAPDSFLLSIAHALSWWLLSVSKYVDPDTTSFTALLLRVALVLQNKPDEGLSNTDRVESALNQPVGYIAQAAFQIWYRQKPSDGIGLSGATLELLTAFQDSAVPAFVHARVFTASNVISLFRVDPEWTKRHLLPCFNWKESKSEALIAWEGFLWTPRLYPPLMVLLKKDFIATASHYAELREHREQYAGFLTYVSLEMREGFAKNDLAAATRLLTNDGLRRALHVLTEALEAAAEQRLSYWENRIIPYLRDVWPKSLTYRTAEISGAFARLCLAADNAFPSALEAVKAWLLRSNNQDFQVQRLKESKLCERFPRETLEYLDLIVEDLYRYAAPDLGVCLIQIEERAPELRTDLRLVRLRDVVRTHT
jgi:hypothetical protein